MPQLDKVTFLSQYFWLLIIFWGFYLFVLKNFLPEMSRILKFRKKRFTNQSAFSLQEERNKVEMSQSSVVEGLLRHEKNVFKDSQSNNDSWFSEWADNVSLKNLKDANLQLLEEVAGKSLSNNLTILALNPNLSEKILSNRVSNLIFTLKKASPSLRGISQLSVKKDQLSEVSNDDLQSLEKGKSNNLKTSSSKSKKDALKKEIIKSSPKKKDEKEKKLSKPEKSVKATKGTKGTKPLKAVKAAKATKAVKAVKSEDLISSPALDKKDLLQEKGDNKKVSTRKSKKDFQSDLPEVKESKKLTKGEEKKDSKKKSKKKVIDKKDDS